MFSSKGLFKAVPCPGGLTCQLPNCIFFHEQHKEQREPFPDVVADAEAGGDRKRIKLSSDDATPTIALKTPVKQRIDSKKPFVGILAPQSSTLARVNPPVDVKSGSLNGLKSLTRQVSPPQKNGTPSPRKDSKADSSKPAKSNATPPKEDLNPRLVGSGINCASHNTRLALLKMLHAQVVRLDTEIRASADPNISSRCLPPQSLVTIALDEEQKVAKHHPTTYRVTMGHKMVQYRKMELPEWLVFLDTMYKVARPPPPPSPFTDELDSDLERTLLSRYILDAEKLKLQDHGFILELPSDEAIASTQVAIEKCDYWEQCDRCQTRFQVFHNRREDGALTSGTACRHHWGRAWRDYTTKEQTWTCCGGSRGSPGCAIHDTHVFITKDKTRLAKALQFEHTPINESIDPAAAVSFDCEMGYTTLGMEMIRVSAITWPSGKVLIDMLVRPIGNILDLNTRFSGVTTDQFLNAQDYTPPLDGTFDQSLMLKSQESILASPAIARSLLFSFITTSTPLIGHSVENDLNVMRIIHPTIVDTVILYPHKNGLPLRFGLKKLTKQYLLKDIQTAGADGHDSLEDARATGDLVRAKLTQEWKLLKSQNWKIEETDGKKHFVPPENWEEKGAGKGYLLKSYWWEVDAASMQTTMTTTMKEE